MKILYAIQGTGNGHLSRALDVIPCLQKHGEVDILVSGIQGDLKLPFEIKYQFTGMSFIFGKKGGVDLWKTLRKASLRKFVKNIKELPVEQYDLVINDFEPVSSWACLLKNKHCIGLSHQAAVLNAAFPLPKESDAIGKLILQQYAPVTDKYGFHFKAVGNKIFTPVIRQIVRATPVTNKGHITVYLPAFGDKRLIKNLSVYKNVTWEVFSKHNKKKAVHKNITIYPINNEQFIASMAASNGVMCGGGFETPAEALFMKKKLLVIPMKNQYEQQLNAEALKSMGVEVIKALKPKYIPVINNWLENGTPVPVDYPDSTQQIIDTVIAQNIEI